MDRKPLNLDAWPALLERERRSIRPPSPGETPEELRRVAGSIGGLAAPTLDSGARQCERDHDIYLAVRQVLLEQAAALEAGELAAGALAHGHAAGVDTRDRARRHELRACGAGARVSWADRAIAELREGRETTIRPVGGSMRPLVMSGARVRLAPLGDQPPRPGEIVLVRVKGSVYLHLVKAVDGERVQIGNNRGGINGWTGRTSVYGRAVAIDNSSAH
jgi:hypothetical protein